MRARSVPLLICAAVVVGAASLAACDAVSTSDSSVVEGHYSGVVSGSLQGRAHAAAYSGGLFVAPEYSVKLDATPPDRPPYTGTGVSFRWGGAGLPTAGVYETSLVSDGRRVMATLTAAEAERPAALPAPLPLTFYARSGTLRVTYDARGHMIGTFRFRALPLAYEAPDTTGLAVVVEGRFRVDPR